MIEHTQHLETITLNATKRSLPIYAEIIKSIKTLLESSQDKNTFLRLLEKHMPLKAAIDLSQLLLDTLQTSNALGRGKIINIDKELSARHNMQAKIVTEFRWFICDNDDSDVPAQISFDVIPKEALEYLKTKSIKIAGVELNELNEAVKQKLIDAIEQGETFADFKKNIDSVFDSYGVTQLSDFHASIVFRMNTFSAYSVGQAQQIADMTDRFPLAYYSPIHDTRSRHIPLEGYYKTDSIPLPPIDYNCRCGVRYIHISQITGNEVVYDTPPAPELIVFDQRDGF